MGLQELRQRVCRVNKDLGKSGLVALTWGNISGVDRQAGVMAIKPSGVDYECLKPEDIVIVSLESGEIVEGETRPSSDTPTHLVLYRGFHSIGGIAHTHSPYASSWAQACREIPPLGTTHADTFFGTIPLTRQLSPEEIQQGYEANTGQVILQRFLEGGLNPEEMPAVLLPRHGAFAWGPDPETALKNAISLEETARIAFQTVLLNPHIDEMPEALRDKHFLRKHGPGAYYGQRS